MIGLLIFNRFKARIATRDEVLHADNSVNESFFLYVGMTLTSSILQDQHHGERFPDPPHLQFWFQRLSEVTYREHRRQDLSRSLNSCPSPRFHRTTVLMEKHRIYS